MNDLQNKVALANQKQGGAPMNLDSMILKSEQQFEKALLGSGMPAAKFIRIILTCVKNNKTLYQVATTNPTSLVASCMEIAQLGLDPSVPNEAFLIPYGDSVKAQYGYKGLAKLAHKGASEAGAPLKMLDCFTVHENDEYARQQGDKAFVKLIPAPFGSDRGDVIGYVAVAKDFNGKTNFVELTADEVEKHQARFSKSIKSSSSPFYGGRKSENFDSYGLKTVLKRLITKHLTLGSSWGAASEILAKEEEAIDVTPKPFVTTTAHIRMAEEKTEKVELSSAAQKSLLEGDYMSDPEK